MFDYIYIILTYRNVQDLKEFFLKFNIANAKVIVVNSFYDADSDLLFRAIARENGADFISVPNNGYGYGNNMGCRYALEHYQFQYLVISNPDIEIVSYLPLHELPNDMIIAPDIVTLKNKRQNPYMVWHTALLDKWKYYAIKKNSRFLLYFLFAFNRIARECFLGYVKLSKKAQYFISSVHGSHVIIPYTVLLKLFPIYNEQMFLFCEEEQMAKLAEKNNVKMVYMPAIKVKHKEDGSVRYLQDNSMEMLKKSYLVYYNTWY